MGVGCTVIVEEKKGDAWVPVPGIVDENGFPDFSVVRGKFSYALLGHGVDMSPIKKPMECIAKEHPKDWGYHKRDMFEPECYYEIIQCTPEQLNAIDLDQELTVNVGMTLENYLSWSKERKGIPEYSSHRSSIKAVVTMSDEVVNDLLQEGLSDNKLYNVSAKVKTTVREYMPEFTKQVLDEINQFITKPETEYRITLMFG